MSNRADNQLHEDQLKRDLLELENSTSSRDLFQLAQARNKALSSGGKRRQRFLWTALGTSLASVALVVLLVNPEEEPLPAMDMASTELQVDDPLYDIYEQLDFYDWLALTEG